MRWRLRFLTPFGAGASWLDLALVSGVIVALQVKNHFGQMVDGEGQLRIFAVVSFLHCAYREQAHAGAVIDPRLQAAEVFRMTEVVVIVHSSRSVRTSLQEIGQCRS